MKFLIALIFINLSVYAGIADYNNCMEGTKQFRQSENIKLSFETVDSYYFEPKYFGRSFSDEFTDNKIQNICLNEDFQNSYVSKFSCTKKFTNKFIHKNISKSNKNQVLWDSKNSLAIDSSAYFNYCSLEHSNSHKIDQTLNCLMSTQSRLKVAQDISGDLGSHFFKGLDSSYLINLCQNEQYLELITNPAHVSIRNCYAQKVNNFHLSNAVKYINLEKFPEISRILSTSNLRAQDRDLLPLAISIYHACANEKLREIPLHKYYANKGFLKCLNISDHNEPVDTREKICASIMDASELDLIVNAPIVKMPSDNSHISNSEVVEDKSFFGSIWDSLFGSSEVKSE